MMGAPFCHQMRSVCKEASVRETAMDGLHFVDQGWPGNRSWLAVGSPVYVGEVDQYPIAQNCRVVSSVQVAVFKLQITRNFGLYEVVRSLKGKARSIVALRMV